MRLPDRGTTGSDRLLEKCIDHCPTSSMGHPLNAHPAKHVLFLMLSP